MMIEYLFIHLFIYLFIVMYLDCAEQLKFNIYSTLAPLYWTNLVKQQKAQYKHCIIWQ